MKVGFIGVGNMGLPMARNLLRAGHSLSVHNRTPGRAESLAGDGATIVSSPSEAARLVPEAAEAMSVPLPLASMVRDHLLTAIANGKGDMDWTALAQLAAENAGLGRAGPAD